MANANNTDVLRSPSSDRRAEHGEANGTLNRIVDDGGDVRAVLAVADTSPVYQCTGGVVRWLDMAGADLSLLNSGRAPLLFGHHKNLDNVIGVVEKAWIDAHILFAQVRFGKQPRCLEVLGYVRDGLLTNVSMGYEALFDAAIEVPPRVRYWRPYEVSLVVLPANWSAHVQALAMMPDDIRARLAADFAATAAGTPSSWRDFAATQGAQIAQAIAAGVDGETALRTAVDAELGRLSDAERAEWLSRPAGGR